MLARLRSPALHSIAGGMLQKSIPFVASLYVARTVGQENFAAFAFSINTANTITAVSALGLAPAILTALSGKSADVDHEGKITAIFLISALICVVAAALGLFSASLQLNAVKGSGDVVGVALLAPALILLQTAQSTYQGTDRHRDFFLQSCGLAIVVALTLLLVSSTQADAAQFGKAYSAAFMVVGLGSILYLTAKMKGLFRNSITRALKMLRPLFVSQLPFAGYTALWMLSIYLCNLRIASDFSVSELAYYNVGFQWYSLMLLVPATLGGVLIPHFVFVGTRRTARTHSLTLTLLFAAIAFPLTLLMYLGSPWMLQLYGMPTSPQGLATVRPLILAGGIAFTLTPSLQQLMALRRFRTLLSVSGCWSLVALSGTYLFASGSDGVAIAFLLAYCTVSLLIIFINLTTRRKRLQVAP